MERGVKEIGWGRVDTGDCEERPINHLDGAQETVEEYLQGKEPKAKDAKKKTKCALGPTTQKRATTSTKTAKLKGVEAHELTDAIFVMNIRVSAVLNVKLEREQKADKAETKEGPEGAGATSPAVVEAFKPHHRWVRGPGSLKRKLR
uniref:Uncharacterized protein n=1 Tax=Globodera rostochiensis TaxID=31243 RepID=A0A914HM99_GLORO